MRKRNLKRRLSGSSLCVAWVTTVLEHDLRREVYQCTWTCAGLGIDRTVAWICGLEHIREAIPFPRMLNRPAP
jgi:hypothetical protein